VSKKQNLKTSGIAFRLRLTLMETLLRAEERAENLLVAIDK